MTTLRCPQCGRTLGYVVDGCAIGDGCNVSCACVQYRCRHCGIDAQFNVAPRAEKKDLDFRRMSADDTT